MWLDQATFTTVLNSTPLIAIDLIVENRAGEILLGKRTNRPAQDYWFVPGGRIRKNETLDDAFIRLTQNELGVTRARSDAQLLGVYEHFYADSVFGPAQSGPSTHYIVLGYRLSWNTEQDAALPEHQHSAYRWWVPAAMQNDPQVHDNSRAYLAALADARKQGQ